MKEYARAFYQSKAWKATRRAYMKSRLGLCERCGKPGEIVHHKRHITPRTVGDPAVTLDWANLELLCRSCHAYEHEGSPSMARGVGFDEDGNTVCVT